ncbi:DNA-binding transcriptional regulator GbsR (MarR family) [Cupriavidus gilardii J11]|uniref:HTH-type transcriptional regulator n=1 Tax=Cupriavidus gilardii J11 TaxID=936133 RepID=A0A562B9N8_9BURK|nr:GbsR/MarR family transcriptional regulator [Cupriavidus gilardii]TWG81874.1 DNA-binding transcriptional regulator GbsR (MarR family) [Cupriavidus gilardii J11]
MNLSPLVQRFVLHFGEMGSRWGINRTVGQIYALLFTAPRPLNADEIAESLGFSRSNVSIGLKELEAWKLVRLSHQPGDRREYFSAPDDVWTIFRTLAEERRRREIDPTLSMLREVQLESPTDPDDRHAQRRMQEMYQLIVLVTGWVDEMQKLDAASLEKLMRLGSRVTKLLEVKDKVSGALSGRSADAKGKSARGKKE